MDCTLQSVSFSGFVFAVAFMFYFLFQLFLSIFFFMIHALSYFFHSRKFPHRSVSYYFVDTFIHLIIQPPIHSSTHSFIHPFIHPFMFSSAIHFFSYFFPSHKFPRRSVSYYFVDTFIDGYKHSFVHSLPISSLCRKTS